VPEEGWGEGAGAGCGCWASIDNECGCGLIRAKEKGVTTGVVLNDLSLFSFFFPFSCPWEFEDVVCLLDLAGCFAVFI